MPIIKINDTKYLKKDTEIKHKDIVVIENEGQWEESDNFKKSDGTPSNQFSISIRLSNGDVRSTILNWTNIKILSQSFGNDSAGWVGKELRAWKTKSEKAKLGYSYLYVPTDWDRDDTGEWIIPEKAVDEISADEMPF
jgi:hypothetical protein